MKDNKQQQQQQRDDDFQVIKRVLNGDRLDAFSIHLSLTMGSYHDVGRQFLIGGLADYLAQYVLDSANDPAAAEDIIDRLTIYMKDRVAGRSAQSGSAAATSIFN